LLTADRCFRGIAQAELALDRRRRDCPEGEMPRLTYLFVCAGAVVLGVVVTDIDTLP